MKLEIAALILTIITITSFDLMGQNEVLDGRQRSIVAIAANEAKGDLEALSASIEEGLDNGLTVNQVKEILSQLYAYTGFPRSLNGLGTLQKVLETREKEGRSVVTGPEASPIPEGYDALRDGTKVQSQLTGRPFKYEFCPAEDYYLKAHLFGDIFVRDVLTWAERELATISALASIEGLDPQLASHVAGSRNMGLKDEEIRAVPAALARSAGESEAYRAAKAIAKVFGEEFDGQLPFSGFDFPKGDPNNAYAKYFIGESFLAPLRPVNLAEGEKTALPLSNVTFEPGCRNNWHIHHGARQILICVGGEGWYQEWGKAAIRLKAGDVVDIPEGVKHWHGAAKDSWFQHLTTHVATGGEMSNEWLESVTDEQYGKCCEGE
jgi:4-carboxymuconolactone decarboxylase